MYFIFSYYYIYKKKLKIYINGISIYNNYKSSFSFFKKNLMNIHNIVLGNEQKNLYNKNSIRNKSFNGLIKSCYILNLSLTDNEIVEIFKPHESKHANNLFEKAFFLNPYVLLNKCKTIDKNRIYSFGCSENLFLVEKEPHYQKKTEKTTFFSSLFKSKDSDEKKSAELPKKLEANIKMSGVFVLEKFRFRETLLGMGNIDIFLFLIENIAFSGIELPDNLFWYIYSF